MNRLDIQKKRAELLKGIEVNLQVNEGRNRFVEYNGKIKDLYPYVFTFEAFLFGEVRLLSFSYVDMMTKKIKIFPASEKNKEIMS